jgi:hypothetical protein
MPDMIQLVTNHKKNVGGSDYSHYFELLVIVLAADVISLFIMPPVGLAETTLRLFDAKVIRSA